MNNGCIIKFTFYFSNTLMGLSRLGERPERNLHSTLVIL